MAIDKSKVTLSFHPQHKGTDLLTLNTLIDNSQFHCDEIVADFSDYNIAVFLSGFFDSGARIKGKLKTETTSQLSILKFIQAELQNQETHHHRQSVRQAQHIVAKELKNLVGGVKGAQAAVEDILRIHAEDFEWSREVITKSLHNYFKRKKKNLTYELPYSSISSFLSIDTDYEHSVQEVESSPLVKLEDRCLFISDSLRLISENESSVLECECDYFSSSFVKDVIGFFRLKHQSSAWIDYEATVQISNERLVLKLDVSHFPPGSYAITSFLQSYYTQERVWYSTPGNDVLCSFPERRTRQKIKKNKKGQIISGISFSTFENFSKWCLKNVPKKGFGSFFFEELKKLESPERDLVFQYYAHAIKNCSRKITKRSASVIKAFRVIGISEVLMVTPEGPHAMAGGLSQVIMGLTTALAGEESAVTIISPFYYEKNGHHHESFDNVRLNGIELNGKVIVPEYLGTVYVEDNYHTELSCLRCAQVFEIQYEKIRMLLISNKELCDRLYGGVSGVDRLRRSSFLCRATLELIKDKAFGCNPDIIMTHDWTTAILPMYTADSGLPRVPIIHVLHNAGNAYQGRFSLIENNEDIFNALSLPKSKKPLILENDGHMLNFTKAGCASNSDALVTVSKPYAQQLVSTEELIDVSLVLKEKKDKLYGISNGIPTQVVQEAAFGSSHELDKAVISHEEIGEMKKRVRNEVSKTYGLSLQSQDILAVLVGRLTDQKGLSILTDIFENSEKSVLENILEDCPNVHFVIAGPPSESDVAFKSLQDLISSKLASHPRFKYRFEFLPHSDAIKLTAAADIFLMPSKYEPGGIAQLEALAVGTSVVAHRVGGLSTTLQQYQKQGKAFTGNSFFFDEFKTEKFYHAFVSAYQAMSNHVDRANIITSAFYSKNDWKDRVPYYLSLFQKVKGIFDDEIFRNSRLPENRLELLAKVSVKN